MDMSYVFWQTSPWLMFLAVCAALYFSLTWPEVKGKWWLVASLSILVFVESFSYVLQNYIGQSNKILMGPNEYQKLWSFSILLTVLTIFSRIAFVIALFQLRIQLQKIKIVSSVKNDERTT